MASPHRISPHLIFSVIFILIVFFPTIASVLAATIYPQCGVPPDCSDSSNFLVYNEASFRLDTTTTPFCEIVIDRCTVGGILVTQSVPVRSISITNSEFTDPSNTATLHLYNQSSRINDDTLDKQDIVIKDSVFAGTLWIRLRRQARVATSVRIEGVRVGTPTLVAPHSFVINSVAGLDDGLSEPALPPPFSIAVTGCTVQGAGTPLHVSGMRGRQLSLTLSGNTVSRESKARAGGRANSGNMMVALISSLNCSSLTIADNTLSHVEGMWAIATALRIYMCEIGGALVVRDNAVSSRSVGSPYYDFRSETNTALQVSRVTIGRSGEILIESNRFTLSDDVHLKGMDFSTVRCNGNYSAGVTPPGTYSTDCRITIRGNTVTMDASNNNNEAMMMIAAEFATIGSSVDAGGYNLVGFSLFVNKNRFTVAGVSRAEEFVCPTTVQAQLEAVISHYLAIAFLSMFQLTDAAIVQIEENIVVSSGSRLGPMQRGGVFFLNADPASIWQKVQRVVVTGNTLRVIDSTIVVIVIVLSGTSDPIPFLLYADNIIDLSAVARDFVADQKLMVQSEIAPCLDVFAIVPSASLTVACGAVMVHGGAREIIVRNNSFSAFAQPLARSATFLVRFENAGTQSDVDKLLVVDNRVSIRRAPSTLAAAAGYDVATAGRGGEFVAVPLGPGFHLSQTGKKAFSVINFSGNRGTSTGSSFTGLYVAGGVLLEESARVIVRGNVFSSQVVPGARARLRGFDVNTLTFDRLLGYRNVLSHYLPDGETLPVAMAVVAFEEGGVVFETNTSAVPTVDVTGNSLTASRYGGAGSGVAVVGSVAAIRSVTVAGHIIEADFSRAVTLSATENKITVDPSEQFDVLIAAVIEVQSTAAGASMLASGNDIVTPANTGKSGSTSVVFYRNGGGGAAAVATVDITADQNSLSCGERRCSFVFFKSSGSGESLLTQKINITARQNRITTSSSSTSFEPLAFSESNAAKLGQGGSVELDARPTAELPTCNRITSSSSSSSSRRLDDQFLFNFLKDKQLSSWLVANASGCEMTATRSVSVVVPPVTAAPYERSVMREANDAAQGATMVLSVFASALAPSLGFAVARQQAMAGLVEKAKTGNCAGIDAQAGIAVADSPTQMQIGSSDGRWYVGAAVGNAVLIASLVLAVQLAGTFFLKRVGSSSWRSPFAVFARCHVAMVLFVCMSLLMCPSLTMSLVVVTVSSVPVGERVLAVIFGVAVASVAVYYTVWALLLRERKEKYRKNFHDSALSAKELQERGCLQKMFAFWFEGPGEWMMPSGSKCSEREHLEFDAGNPQIDGFSDRAFWFSMVEFGVQIALAVAGMIVQFVPMNINCVTHAVIQAVIFGGYLFLCLWKRPFQELFLRIATPIMVLCQIVIVVIVAAMVSSGLPVWIDTLVIFVVSLQSFVAIFTVLAALQPMVKWALKAWKRYKSRVSGAPVRHRPKTWTVQDLLRDEDRFAGAARDDDDGIALRSSRRSRSRHASASPRGSSSRRDDHDVEMSPRSSSNRGGRQQQERGSSHRPPSSSSRPSAAAAPSFPSSARHRTPSSTNRRADDRDQQRPASSRTPARSGGRDRRGPDADRRKRFEEI